MKPLTCHAAVHAASDELVGLLSDAERGALEDHLADCEQCSCILDQLRSTVAVLSSRPEVRTPKSLRAMLAHVEGGRAEALVAELPRLYALAYALNANAADDLVQQTLASAVADAGSTVSSLAGTLRRLANGLRADVDSPVVPTPASDPAADAAGLFYTDGPAGEAWVDPPAAWGVALVLGPEDDLVTTEIYGIVDAALAELDPIDADLVALVDIAGVPFGQAVVDLDLHSGQARVRLARARLKVRAALDQYLRS